MTLKQIRTATLRGLADGDIEAVEGKEILAAIDRQIAAGRDPDLQRGPIIDLDRLPAPSEVVFEQMARQGRRLAAGRQGIGAPDGQG